MFLPPHTDTHTPTPIGTLVGVGRLGYDVAISEDNFQQYARSWADREMKVYSTHTHTGSMIRLCCFIDFAQPKEERKEGKEEERAAI